MSNEAYFHGFLTKCAEFNIDPEALVKAAAPGDQAARFLSGLASLKAVKPGKYTGPAGDLSVLERIQELGNSSGVAGRAMNPGIIGHQGMAERVLKGGLKGTSKAIAGARPGQRKDLAQLIRQSRATMGDAGVSHGDFDRANSLFGADASDFSNQDLTFLKDLLAGRWNS